MSISKRLQMVIEMNKMTNASFADKIGVQRSSISHVLAGRNKPSIDFIQKILITFPKVDAGWLITGQKSENRPAEDSKYSSDQTVLKAQKQPAEDISSTKENEAFNTESKSNQEREQIKNTNVPPNQTRKVSKVIAFYNDGTFQELISIE